MPTVDARQYLVGDFLIDTARYRISSVGAAVPVEPKVFDLLVYLIRHRDRVVTREELFEKVWDGRPVSDATLSNHVKSARKALGDSGELQQTIQTVRGRGYQFVAAVSEVSKDAAASMQTAAAPRPTARRRGPARLLAGSLLLVLAALPGLWLYTSRSEVYRPYVLVLPSSVSGSASRDHQLFAEQLPREVISNLGKIDGLKVAREPWGGTRNRIQAQMPDIDFVLGTNIISAPDGTLRVTATLTDQRQDRDVWSNPVTVRIDNENFLRTTAEIAKLVARALKVRVLKKEQIALAELPGNLAAYDPYAAGWSEMELFTLESLDNAVRFFEQAIKLDGDYLAAYLGRSEALRSIFAYYRPPSDLLQRVTDSLQDVLDRDPYSAQALSSLGVTQVLAWQWKEGYRNLSKARSLDNSLAPTEMGFALYYSAMGEREKVKESLRRANELDPLNTELADWGNWALFMVGALEESRKWGEKQMTQHPDNGFVFCGAGISAYLRKDTAAGVRLAQKGVELTKRSPVALIMLAQAKGYAGKTDEVWPLLEEAEAANIYMCPYETAVAYLSTGDESKREKAITLLLEAVEKRSNCLIFLRNDPRLRVLREDPRYSGKYAELLVAVGLDDAAVNSYEK